MFDNTKNNPYLWLVVALAGVVVLLPFYSIRSLSDYLPLHMAMDTASIVVAFLIFGVVWKAYSEEQAGNIVILAIGLMAAGLLDFAHMLSYKGMPVFITPGSPEKTINFWLAARLLTVLTFVVAAVRPWRPFYNAATRYLLLLLALLLVALVYWAGLWHEQAWPHTFIEGEGLTAFKVGAGYMNIALFALATALFFRDARRGRYSGATSLAAAAAILVLSELSFIFYAEVNDSFDFLGHLYRVVAFALVHSSVFVSSVREPFERLRDEEQALVESEQRFRQLAENIDDVFWLTDWPGGRVVYVSPAFERVWGIPASALDKDPMLWREYVLEEYRVEIDEAFERAVKGAGAYEATFRIRRDDGEERWIHERGFTVSDGTGRVVRVAGIASDVTETRRLERAVEDSEHRLQAIFHAAQDGIVVADLDSRHLVMANEAFCEMLGISVDEVNTLKVEDIHPPERLDEVLEQFRQQAAGKIGVAQDIPVLRRDGSVFYADFNSTPLEIDGRPSLLHIARDATERRRLEHEIAASQERLALALRGARDGLIDWDIEHGRVCYSPRWKKLIGCGEEEIGEGFDEWEKRVEPTDLPGLLEAIQAATEGRTDRLKAEFRLRHNDGHWIWIMARGHVIRDKHDQPVRMVATHADISEIKQAQQREHEALIQLRRRIKEIQCLQQITALETKVERPLDDLLQQAVSYLPPAWQHPEQACAQIRFDEAVFNSDGFVRSEWAQREAIKVNGIERGEVTVCYRQAQVAVDDGPFLKEERELIAAVAIQLGGMLELRESQAALQRVNRILTTLSESNRSLVRARTEQSLVASICQILVTEGSYTRAWISYLDKGQRQLKQKAAAFAPATYYLEHVDVALDEQNNIAVRALTEDKLQVVGENASGKCILKGREDPKRAYAAVIALPLKIGKEVIGVLVVCSADRMEQGSREVELLEELAGDLAYGINTLRTRGERDRALMALEGMLFQTIEAIARTVEKRDPYTAGHQQRVAELAEAIAREMDLEASQITGIRLGSTIHDIGKIYIPAEVLNRPGRLSEQEFALIKTHPDVGYDIVEGIDFPWPVREMIRQHHERLDGSGYPEGLKGDEIILEARILAVADVVEATTAHRPYRPALGLEKGLEVLREGRGSIFDTEVVDCCVRLFEEKGFHWQVGNSTALH